MMHSFRHIVFSNCVLDIFLSCLFGSIIMCTINLYANNRPLKLLQPIRKSKESLFKCCFAPFFCFIFQGDASLSLYLNYNKCLVFLIGSQLFLLYRWEIVPLLLKWSHLTLVSYCIFYNLLKQVLYLV